MTTQIPSKELQTAIDAAKTGANEAMKYFDKNIAVEFKEDETPVTKADFEAENAIKNYILSKLPNSNFVGEETGGDISASEFWIADPIDGTRSFARGIPMWCVIVAFCKNNEVMLAAVYYPFSDTCYYAQKGAGAFMNGKRMHVSNMKDLKKSYLGFGSIKHFEDKQTVLSLSASCASARSWEVTYSSCLVAEGKMDVSVDAYGRIWDLAPFKVMIEEAGGKITRFNGDPWTFQGHGALITNGLLHKSVLEILSNKS